MGKTEPTLMGMDVLCTTDDNSKKHVFTLTHVNYIPQSPVNLLSTQVLSKQYVNDNGFDKHGTGVLSTYDTHVLIWDHRQYSKTFKTHSSGLPECLFNSGFSHLNTFTTFLMQHYDDTIDWAFSSEVKDKELAASNDGDGIATLSRNGDVTLDVPATLANMVAFFQGMKLRYNDGLGTRDIVTFLGADFVEDMQLKCNIKLSNDLVILVDIETLNFIENPDIASIPETCDDYF